MFPQFKPRFKPLVVAALFVVLAENDPAFANDRHGLFICTVAELGGEGSQTTKVGDRKLIGVAWDAEELTELYPSGLGVIRECEDLADLLVCEIAGSMTRKIVLDRSTLTLTSPFGFKDGFVKSDCESFPL